MDSNEQLRASLAAVRQSVKIASGQFGRSSPEVAAELVAMVDILTRLGLLDEAQRFQAVVDSISRTVGPSQVDRIVAEENAMAQEIGLYGENSRAVANRLMVIATLLRANNQRLLDAVNMEARSKAIIERIDGCEMPGADSVRESNSDTKTCTHCAKAIKKRARVCRFCKTTCLVDSVQAPHWLEYPPLPVGGSGHAAESKIWPILIATCLIAVAGFCVVMPVQLATAKGRISGGAYITLKDGSSVILRGLEVTLCEYEMLEELENDSWFKGFLEKFGKGDSEHVGDSYLLCAKSTFQLKVLQNKLRFQTAKTDIDGKYSFDKVSAGSYCLAATTRVGNSTAFWAVPVFLSAGETATSDFSQSNMIAAGSE